MNKFCSKLTYFRNSHAKGHDRNQVLAIVLIVYTNDWLFVHKNEQINLIWLIPRFISRQKPKTVFSTGELIDKTIFKFQEPSGQFHLLLITLANLDAFLFQSFNKKNIGKKYWLLSLNMCNWKMLTIMMNSWGTFFYWLTTDVSEHVSQARAQKSRNAERVNRLPVWRKGEKKNWTYAFPLLAIFSPFPQTESLFTC